MRDVFRTVCAVHGKFDQFRVIALLKSKSEQASAVCERTRIVSKASDTAVSAMIGRVISFLLCRAAKVFSPSRLVHFPRFIRRNSSIICRCSRRGMTTAKTPKEWLNKPPDRKWIITDNV